MAEQRPPAPRSFEEAAEQLRAVSFRSDLTVREIRAPQGLAPDAIARLNAIVHPAVRAESARRFSEAFAADADAVVVYDVPLLVEARPDDPWALIVVAHAPAALRAERLVELRGMSEADAAARIASQVSDDARLAVADVVIDTAGTMDDTHRQVDDLWATLGEHIAHRAARA